MRYQETSTPQKAQKNKGAPLALKLLSASATAVIVLAGCAEIPPDDNNGGDGGEVAAVTVEVTGGVADIFPGQEFSVPVGADTLIFINVAQEPNTRIAGIWVDGGRMCCDEDGVVRDTGIALIGVGGGVAVIVELAKIDTVPPVVEIVSPAPTASGGAAASISVCSFGLLEYKLNKTMASGYIKWRSAGSADSEDKDSLRVIKIPGDITRYTHDIGGWSYSYPDAYLSEGSQKFDLAVSPVAGKRISRDQIAALSAYAFEIQFTDSLGNKSGTASRTVWATEAPKGGCP